MSCQKPDLNRQTSPPQEDEHYLYLEPTLVEAKALLAELINLDMNRTMTPELGRFTRDLNEQIEAETGEFLASVKRYTARTQEIAELSWGEAKASEAKVFLEAVWSGERTDVSEAQIQAAKAFLRG